MATVAAKVKSGVESQVVLTPAGVAAPESVQRAAREAVARALGAVVDQVQIERVEAVVWNDASLGCREEGKLYAQALTPGFRLTAAVAGQLRQVHADLGGAVVVCERPTQ